jgi:hypothetical protein
MEVIHIDYAFSLIEMANACAMRILTFISYEHQLVSRDRGRYRRVREDGDILKIIPSAYFICTCHGTSDQDI